MQRLYELDLDRYRAQEIYFVGKMTSSNSRIALCLVMMSFGTDVDIGVRVSYLFLVDDLCSLITSLPCIGSPLLVSVGFVAVFMTRLLFENLPKRRRGMIPIRLVKHFTSFAILVCSVVRLIELALAVYNKD